MGIDVYLNWNGQTQEEIAAQLTGFSVVHGRVGYLREAYHGHPYGTKVLMPEAFDRDNCVIASSTLKERLPATLEAVAERERTIYHHEIPDPETLKSFVDFVDLHERLEQDGKQPTITVSA